MRHFKRGRKLGRSNTHRKAMFRNMVTSLLQHERIVTAACTALSQRAWRAEAPSLYSAVRWALGGATWNDASAQQLSLIHI